MVAAEAFAAAHGIDLAQSAFYSDSFTDAPMLRRVMAIPLNSSIATIAFSAPHFLPLRLCVNPFQMASTRSS